MRLSEYLSAEQLSLTDFAKAIGVSAEAVRRYRDGDRTPRPEQMVRIKAATSGAVTADDFMPSPEQKTEAA